MRHQAQEWLKRVYGPGADFRSGQWEAIDALVVKRQRVLVVQRTGWGKSLVYFLATRLLRDQGSGPTLIVSPLLALMRNQQEAAAKLGLKPASINSNNRDEWDQVKEALAQDRVDLLLLSPEQLGSEHFANSVLPAIQRHIGLLVVDEAHCISDWGHDFRPTYRRILRIVQQLPSHVPLLGTTATANQRVVEDVAAQLGPNLLLQRGPLVRESLVLQTIRLADQAERLAWLAEHIPTLPGNGIIYCLTVADTLRVTHWLRKQGINAAAYHGQLDSEERRELESRFQRNEIKALVATVALGMGYDKPDIGFVVHYQRPGSVVAYYQQVGRAGREINRALAILLNGREDDEIQEYFINNAFPNAEETVAVVRLLEAVPQLTRNQILQRLNISQGRLERILDLLQIDEVIGKDGPNYFRTLNRFRLNRPEQEKITALRRAELARMQAFVDHPGCLMEFIEDELDDPAAAPCGRCANCAGDVVPHTVNDKLVRAAIGYLQRDNQIIEPRKKWEDLRNIPAEQQTEPGRALCMWGDAGWGRLVREGKYNEGWFHADLVEAMAEMIQGAWVPEPAPAWVTAVPSQTRPELVSGFARRLADRLGLPYCPVLEKKGKQTRPQKEMQNSAQQARNAREAFRVNGQPPDGPVLLVDDVVDSRWTLTICGALLRSAGSGPVYPVALATAAGGDSV